MPGPASVLPGLIAAAGLPAVVRVERPGGLSAVREHLDFRHSAST